MRARPRHGSVVFLSAVVTLLVAAALRTLPVTEAGFTATTENVTNSFAAEAWKAIIALDGGTSHTCLARNEGSVWCWGRNDKGQLGDTTTVDRWTPVQVTGPGGTDVLDLATGSAFSCTATRAGEAWCWGENNDGQLGNNTTTDAPSPVQVVGPGGVGVFADAVGVAGGLDHSCAVRSDGTVWCWGRNDRGQLGDNTTTDKLVPVQVAGPGGVGVLSGVASVTVGAKLTCAVKSDGTQWCWGHNGDGQLGDDSTTDRSVPVQVVGPGGAGVLSGVIEAAAGEGFTCAVTSAGSVWCWGRNDKGQLGDNSTTDSLVPVQVTGAGGVGFLAGATRLGAGLKHGCAVASAGSVWCWGLNDKGQLGDNTTTDQPAPVQVKDTTGIATLTNATLVGLGDSHSCGARSDFTAWCWGLNDRGQLGDNTTINRWTPVQVKGGGWTGVFADAVGVAGGLDHSCAVRSDGTVWCWGRNDRGQLGDNTTTDKLVPVQVAGPGGVGVLSGVASVTAGAKLTCAVKSDGTQWCWGHNGDGQLGDDSTTDRSVPVQVVGPGGAGVLSGVIEAAAGEGFTCAVTSAGSVWCWGRNDKGQLGDNSTTDSLVPVQVTGAGGVGFLAGATRLGAGLKHGCAVASAGSVWCWGLNDKGQLGDNTTTDQPAPVQVKDTTGIATLTNATLVGLGDSHSCAVTSDTTVWCWGLNDRGQLGDNTTTDTSLPVHVTGAGGSGTLSGIDRADLGSKHTCTRGTDGSVWCWGLNNKGQLGDNTTTDQPAPVQVKGAGGVGTVSDAVEMTAGSLHACAVRAGGTVWCWGDNPSGQLGDGTTTGRQVPVQVL